MKIKTTIVRPGAILCWKEYNIFTRLWNKLKKKDLPYNKFEIIPINVELLTIDEYNFMRNQVSIYTELSNKYNIPYPIIEVICNSPFRFTNSIISNLDPKPVRFSYLGKFKLKKRYEKETV